jgi:cell wall-associated NlpC family hydrolase
MPSRSQRKSAWAAWVSAWVSAGLLMFSSAAFSAPDEANDAITRLLMEKGLIPASPNASAPTPTESPLVRQVRDTASDMVITAMNFLGVPYKRGGNNQEDGFDCSGFTRHIFEMSLGLVLPRRADDQASAPGLLQIARDDLKPGDLVFFNTLKRTFSHVGIYIGEGKFIHSPRTGGAVRVEDMRFAYWNTRFTGARRVEAPTEAEAQAAKAAAVSALTSATANNLPRPSAK